MPLELLQDSDLSSVTIGPHWPSSYPEYLSPHQDKDEQRRVVWARILSQRSNLADRLSKQNERYQALRRELNPRTTQVGSSHNPLYRDTTADDGATTDDARSSFEYGGYQDEEESIHEKAALLTGVPAKSRRVILKVSCKDI